tara:strand:+ start:1066 stop:1380 length:315 start_codon:yes stop_codon:yes gene_type:complete
LKKPPKYMPCFIKTETIKSFYLKENKIKKETIQEHRIWVKKLLNEGFNIKSGFLVDKSQIPGAGGLLIIECDSYEEAEKIIRDDPMIKRNIVNWNLNEWINIFD